MPGKDNNASVKYTTLDSKEPVVELHELPPVENKEDPQKKLDAEEREALEKSLPELKDIEPLYKSFVRLSELYVNINPEKSYDFLNRAMASGIASIPAIFRFAEYLHFGLKHETNPLLPNPARARKIYEWVMTTCVLEKNSTPQIDYYFEAAKARHKTLPIKPTPAEVATQNDFFESLNICKIEQRKKRLQILEVKMQMGGHPTQSTLSKAWTNLFVACKEHQNESPNYYKKEKIHALMEACRRDAASSYHELTQELAPNLVARRGLCEKAVNEFLENKNMKNYYFKLIFRILSQGGYLATDSHLTWHQLTMDEKRYAGLRIAKEAIQFYSKKRFFNSHYDVWTKEEIGWVVTNDAQIATMFKVLFLQLCEKLKPVTLNAAYKK